MLVAYPSQYAKDIVSQLSANGERTGCRPKEKSSQVRPYGSSRRSHAVNMRHPAEAAHPQAAILCVGHGKHIVGEQAIASTEHGEGLTIRFELGEPAAGAGPQLAVRTFVEHEDVIGGQAVLDGVTAPALAVEARQTAAPGAAPHHTVIGDGERDDVVGII